MVQPQPNQGDWVKQSLEKIQRLRRQIKEIESLPCTSDREARQTRERVIAELKRSIKTIEDDL